ncbi:MAG: sialate O-acetylesterase [Flavobacteriales bacterium]|nr:sialate O-acetylesterase [Flavobacteriales bacterium]
MKHLKRTALLSFFALILATASFAEVKLPAIVSSNMVLQRNTTITLWGWANAKEEITIKASWLNEEIKATADKEGNWKVEAKTTNTKEPQTITIKSDESNILLENVLLGEVWLCSGQSNMEMKLSGNPGQPIIGSLDAIANANNKNLRIFTVEKLGSLTPEDTIGAHRKWQSVNPENVNEFSAIAYFFGQQLQEILDVPVGMIHSSWGGSLVEAWMSKEALSPIQPGNLDSVDLERGNRFPEVLFNAMINPLIPYTIKGTLWYQGESNRETPNEYMKLFPAMVKDWRTRWGIGDFPFYYVQIAPFWYNEDDFSYPWNSAFIRESQLKCLDLIPNSGMAVTLDIGEQYCIHPPKKKEVADRLLYIALNQTYGIESINYSGPVHDSTSISSDRVTIFFKHVEKGLYNIEGFGKEIKGFEIAGEDKVFYPATAKIFGRSKVLVKSDQVKEPVAVRYAWSNWVEGTLFNGSLLPASSFRTDIWEDATRLKKEKIRKRKERSTRLGMF